MAGSFRLFRGGPFAVAVFAAFLCIVQGALAVAQTQVNTFPVPVVTIYPGEEIRDDMIELRPFNAQYPSRSIFIDNPKVLHGKVARRTLLPGQPIQRNAIENAKVVQRGVPTQIIYRAEGVMITALVTPLQAGESGEAIRVRNNDSGLVVVGVVQADGTILVGGESGH